MSTSFLFLSVDFPWTQLLAEEMSLYGVTKITKQCHYFNYKHSIFPTEIRSSDQLSYERWVFPPGYSGKLGAFGSALIRSRIRKAVSELRNQTSNHPWVVVPMPHLYEGLSEVPDERLIYYNFDDYSCYPEGWNSRVAERERALIERCALTVCTSQQQLDRFCRSHPTRVINHLPLGVDTSFINPSPYLSNISDRFTVGYVGSLTDRVDWRFVKQTISRCPDIDFIFVGKLENEPTPGGNRIEWISERDEAFALPNVHYLGPVPQEEVPRFYWSFGMSWIPYDINHQFNIASSPTKIMDGISAGNPVISTAVPECKLHPEWITITEQPSDAQLAIEEIKAQVGSNQAKAKYLAQVDYARANDWKARADQLISFLGI